MGIRKILGDINKSYQNKLANSEAKYRAKQSKFLNEKKERELKIRKIENEQEIKKGNKPLDPKYIEYGSNPGLSQALKEMGQREDRKRIIQEPSSPSRSQLLKARGTQSSTTRKLIK